jgi:hypothetical protein
MILLILKCLRAAPIFFLFPLSVWRIQKKYKFFNGYKKNVDNTLIEIRR